MNRVPKLLFILGALSLTQGCSVLWKAKVANESPNDIYIHRDDTKTLAWLVKSGRRVEITWNYSCMEIVENGQSLFFSTNAVPEPALDMGGINYTVKTLYRDRQLYYVVGDNTYQEVPKMAACPNA